MKLIEHIDHLPYLSHPLIGREDLLASIQQQLAPHHAILLYGAAGAGKRSLAAVIAASHLQNGGQVLWIAGDTIDRLACRVLMAYQARDDNLDRAKTLLARHKPLVVLISPPDAAAQFIRSYSQNQVPVLILHETATDGPWEPVLVRRLDEQVSRQLLMGDNDAQSAAFNRVSDYVNGHPLALRLIALHLQQNIISLNGLAQALPPRHQPHERLMMVIQRLFEQLDKASQGLLMAISAGFNHEISAELLAKMLNIPQAHTERLCKTLVTRGFLYQRKSGTMPCYTIHPLIQTFGQQQLKRNGQFANARQRMVRAIVDYLNAHARDNDDAEQALLLEMDHILAAADYSQQQDLFDLADAIYRSLSRMAALMNSCAFQARWLRFREQHKRHPSKRDTQESQVIKLDESPVAAPAPDQPPEATTAISTSTELILRDELQIAYDTALSENNLPEMARIKLEMGEACAEQNRSDLALEHFQQAIKLYQELGDLNPLLTALENAAIYSLRVEGASEAHKYVNRALNIAAQLNEEVTRGRLMSILGDVRADSGDARGAVEAYKQAIKILRGADESLYNGITLSKLASVYMEKQRYREAILALSRAVSRFEAVERRDLMGRALGNMGTALGLLGNWHEAGQRHAAAMRIARELGDHEEEFFQLRNLAFVAETEGLLKWAVNYNRQALYLVVLKRDQPLMGEVAFDIGRLLMTDPEGLAQAEVLLEQSQRLNPRPETENLLDETRYRLNRRLRNRLIVAPAEDDLYRYAAAAYPSKKR